MKTAVITGANGFIGTALCRLLNEKRIHTFAIVRSEKSDVSEIQSLPYVHVVYGDMEHLETLPEKIGKPADVFYHLAWDSSSGDGRCDYHKQLKNVEWTVNAVKTAAALGCKRFVGAGSLVEYDVNSYIPKDGSTPDSVQIYGVAKLAAHYMSKIVASAYPSLCHCWAILSHIYGVGDHTNNFVNFAAKLMLTGQPANFTEGKQLTDFLSIENTVGGLYCIGEKGKKNTAYYVGSGEPRRLREYIYMIRDAIDPTIPLHLGAVPFHGVIHPAEIFDATKLMNDTGYCPQRFFEEDVHKVISWIQMKIATGDL